MYSLAIERKGAEPVHTIESVYNRKSIRGFKQDPVPKETIKKILDQATRAAGANRWIALLIGLVLPISQRGYNFYHSNHLGYWLYYKNN